MPQTRAHMGWLQKIGLLFVAWFGLLPTIILLEGCGSSETRMASPSVSLLGILNDSTVVLRVTKNQETCEETLQGSSCYGNHAVNQYVAVFALRSHLSLVQSLEIDTSYSLVTQLSESSFVFLNGNGVLGYYNSLNNRFDEVAINWGPCKVTNKNLRARIWKNETILLSADRSNSADSQCNLIEVDILSKSMQPMQLTSEDKWLIDCDDFFFSSEIDKPVCAKRSNAQSCNAYLFIDDVVKDSVLLGDKSCELIGSSGRTYNLNWFGNYLATPKSTNSSNYLPQKLSGDTVMSVDANRSTFNKQMPEIWFSVTGVIFDGSFIPYSSFPFNSLLEN